MIKKHYEAIAKIIRETQDTFLLDKETALEYVAIKLSDYFAGENTRFDKGRFLKACGVLKGPIRMR